MEKGGPPYHADGSLDYPESAFFLFQCILCILNILQWRTRSRYFLSLYLNLPLVRYSHRCIPHSHLCTPHKHPSLHQ